MPSWIAGVEARCPQLTLASPRDPHGRGSQVSVAFADGYAAMQAVVNAIASNDKAAAEAAYKSAVPVLDRSAQQGLISKNKAARHKSRLNARIKVLSA